MNNNLQNVYFHVIKQEIKDPIGTFLDLLYSGKGLKVSIPSQEENHLENLNGINKPGFVQVNLDKSTQISNTKPTKFAHLGYKRSPSYPNREDKIILEKLNKIPVYSVVNGLGEIVIASPRSLKPLSFFDWIYEKYFNNFIWTKDEGPVNVGLFFMHKEDAEMYLHEICLQDPKGVEEYGIDIKVSGLDNYYHLNKISPPKTQVKLIGDLKEIDSVIKKYTKDKNYKKNPKQLYTKNGFKGTPIYIMNTIDTNKYNPESKIKQKITGNYGSSGTLITKMIFFNKKDADYMWQKYATELKTAEKNPPLSQAPNLEIYNLENYLIELQKEEDQYIKQIRFIPSSESYSYIRELQKKNITVKNESIHTNIEENIKTKIKSIQRFYKGIIWLFTSDTLPTEENSW